MGKAFKFGDNIDTDAIVPGKYLSISDPDELGKVSMDGIKTGFATQIEHGDVFVAGKNFGSGSSREHAPISIKASGVQCVIAETFARIFYRNAINIGLPVLESPEASRSISENDIVSVDFIKGSITNETKNEIYTFVPYDKNILEIINVGGYKQYIKNKKAEGEKK